MTALGRRSNVNQLSPRERQVFDLLRQGKSNAEIASMLGISVRTVERYVEPVLEKTELTRMQIAQNGQQTRHIA